MQSSMSRMPKRTAFVEKTNRYVGNGFVSKCNRRACADVKLPNILFPGRAVPKSRFSRNGEYASNKGIYTSTSTNAHYLKDENAKATV